jgi:hypothetical protein
VSLFSSDLKWEVFYISCYSDQTTMFCFIRDLLQAIFKAVTFNRKNLIFALLMLRKQNEILKRQIDSRKERLQILSADCWSFAMIAAVSKPTISLLQIFKPETVLAWQRRLISRNWTFSRTEPGRKPVSAETKNLILKIKNENIFGRKVISEYVDYDNRFRPHQGIECIPSGRKSAGDGTILKLPILSGLHQY